jgi:predicted NUDIX family phosphoesterase
VSEELVFVVARETVLGERRWHGVLAHGADAYLDVIARSGEFRPRGEMELDPSYKQVIPYLVLRDGESYFLMRRTRAGADARLHDRWSIGIGGHLNPGDGDVVGGLVREWEEELDASFVPEFRLVGLLNDDSTDVGAVHLGVVFIADAGGRPVSVRETEKLAGSFAAPSAVRAVHDALETWSQLVFDLLDGDARGAPDAHPGATAPR